MGTAKKYFALGALILAVCGTMLVARNRDGRMQETTLKIVLLGKVEEALSPENISTIPLYHVHYNLWDRLLGANGSPSLAKSFNVSPDRLTYTFELDEEAKFSNGRPIQAEDIKFSIDRLVHLEKNGHINARGVIGETKVTTPHSISIILKEPTPSFIFLVSSPEFGIVPKEACDNSGKITNLGVTSGAYNLEKIDSKNQTFLFSKNASYRRADPSAPGKVILLFKENAQAIGDSIASAEADFYELYDSSALKILGEHKGGPFIAQVTKPSVSTFLTAKEALSSEQAKYFSYLFRKDFNIPFESELEKRSRQLLPPRSFASLSDQDLAALARAEAMAVPLPKNVVVQTGRAQSPLMDAIRSFLEKNGSTVTVVGYDHSGPVHFDAGGQGMNLDFPEIELNLALLSPYAYIPATEETKISLRAAIHESNESKRADLLKKIGLELLEEGRVIPCTIRSYVHIFNKKRIDASGITNYDGEIPFFKIRML